MPRQERRRQRCSGTHDTDTVVGWFRQATPQVREDASACAGNGTGEIPVALIRLALNSTASTVIAPVQDLLGLGTRAYGNHPRKTTGNPRIAREGPGNPAGRVWSEKAPSATPIRRYRRRQQSRSAWPA